MTEWDWLFGIVGVIGTAIGAYSLYRSQINKTIESANYAVQQERIRGLHNSLVSTLHSVDAIVQVSKRPETTTAHLGDLARLARAQLYAVAGDAEKEDRRLRMWRFGKMLKSDPDISMTRNVEHVAQVLDGADEPNNQDDAHAEGRSRQR